MENNFEIIEEKIRLTDKDIFTKIWISPRRVFKFINDNHYDKYVTILLILAGIYSAFNRATLRNMGNTFSVWVIIGLCIVGGGIFGWLFYYIYAVLVSWSGKWLKGQSKTKSILRIIAYAMFPSIVAMVFLIPQISIYGVEIFKSNGDLTSADWFSNTVVVISAGIEFVLVIWSIVICIIGISEVQKLSILKSILNLILPLAILIIPIAIIAFIFGDLFK